MSLGTFDNRNKVTAGLGDSILQCKNYVINDNIHNILQYTINNIRYHAET